MGFNLGCDGAIVTDEQLANTVRLGGGDASAVASSSETGTVLLTKDQFATLLTDKKLHDFNDEVSANTACEKARGAHT